MHTSKQAGAARRGLLGAETAALLTQLDGYLTLLLALWGNLREAEGREPRGVGQY